MTAADLDPEKLARMTAGLEALAVITGRLNEATEALISMVEQHCGRANTEGQYDTGALTANAEAVEFLAAMGLVKVIRGYGRMIVFEWVKS